jgi:hypothetical protein
MKTLGLCSLLLSVLVSSAPAQELLSAPAQDPSKAPILNPEEDALRKWLTHAGRDDWSKLEDGRLVISQRNSETGCAYMRTYRVKREERDSDAVRPAGYTVCVPMRRFEMKSTVLRPPTE